MRKDAGVDGDAQRISQMVWMLFLKIFSDQEKEWQFLRADYKSPIPEKLKWQNWAEDDEGDTGEDLMTFINTELFPTLKELDVNLSPQAAIVKSVFEDTYNYMKNGTLFRQVINEIDKINFNKKDDRHVFNDIYEAILKELQSAGSSGEYYTPRAITQFMVDMIDPQLGEMVLDPACGTGGFLTCAIDHVRTKANRPEDTEVLQKSIRGVEKKPLPHLLCTTNLILHGFDRPAVTRGNLLTRSYESWTSKERVNIILSNPPFGGTEEDGTEKNFPTKYRTKETADLFLALIIRLLKKGGRAAVVLPDGSLFGEGIKTNIKKTLLTQCNLHTIVRLPNGVFNPYTNIKSNLLFFDKGEKTKEVWYYELPYPDGVKSFNRTRPLLRRDFDELAKWWKDRKENDLAWKTDIQELHERGFNLDVKNIKAQEVEEEVYSSTQLLESLENRAERMKGILSEMREFLNQ